MFLWQKLIYCSKTLFKYFTLFSRFSLWIFFVIEISDDMSTNLMMKRPFKTDFIIWKWQSNLQYNLIFKIQNRSSGKTLSRKHDLYIILKSNLLQIIIYCWYYLFFSKNRIWQGSISIVHKDFICNFFIFMMDLIILWCHYSLVLKMRIVRILMFEKVCHLLKVIGWKKIF